MGVSINRGTQKWMVYFMENPIKIDDLGVPLFLETPTFINDKIDGHQVPGICLVDDFMYGLAFSIQKSCR